MARIKIILDTACDIDINVAKEKDFGLIPFYITIDEKTYKDRIEISSSEFFEKMQNSKVLPKTSQPNPEDFLNEFSKYADYDDIICFCVTSKASGAYNSANIAKEMLIETGFTPNIHIIDTLNASSAIMVLVEKAEILMTEGKCAEEIVAHINSYINKAAIYFVLDTLEYVRRGGRIGNVKALIGGVLNIKPLLSFVDGACIDVGKCRGSANVKKILLEKFDACAENFSEVIVLFSMHKDAALEIVNDMKEKYIDIKVSLVEVGPVMGTYAGPGGVGIAFAEKNPRW